ncbi:MAG TPA: acetyl-CoA C-acyltransferase, partial [Acidimicrobiales bacterium]|nr:acetyl-CoA C-acyltransferase [Acidimicrobiales bacterium]
MPELNDAVVVAATRSPIGRANKGSLVDKRADELMADVLVALMDQVPSIDRADVQDIICGNVAQ